MAIDLRTQNDIRTRGRAYAGAPATYAAALFALAAAGCAPESDAAGETSATDPLALQSSNAGGTLRAPDGAYFADVSATGSGCPPGSTNTSISSDGQVFTTTFSQYEVHIDPSQLTNTKDCQISVKLHSPQGLSYAVSAFYYAGYSDLDPGVSGRQLANYYFEGAAVNSRAVRTDLIGPRDEPYTFSDEVEVKDNLVWSPCGAERQLDVLTRIQLQNGLPAGSGYMNLTSLDGSTKLVFKLAWRTCNAASGQPDAGAPAKPPASQAGSPSGSMPAKPPANNNGRGGLGDVTGGLGDVVGGLGGVLGGVGGLLGGVVKGVGDAVGAHDASAD